MDARVSLSVTELDNSHVSSKESAPAANPSDVALEDEDMGMSEDSWGLDMLVSVGRQWIPKLLEVRTPWPLGLEQQPELSRRAVTR